jgi:hypothetical protein
MNDIVQHQPKSSMNVGGTPMGVVPHGFEEMWRFSQMVAKSGLCPQGLKTPEAVMVALQQGMELGLMPMQALRGIAVVNGRPTMWGEVMLGLVRSRGHTFREWYEDDQAEGLTAYCELSRHDTGEKIIGRFSHEEATHAGLTKKPGPWQQYPRRMLMWRARGYACRDGASDVLSGFMTPDEAEDLAPQYPAEPPIKDVTPPKPAPKPVVAKPAAKDEGMPPIPPQFDRRQKRPEPQPEPEADAGDLPAEVAEFLRMIGEPNVDRESWDQWLALDVLPLTGDVAVEEADAFIQALEWLQTSQGLQGWGAPMFEDWRATVRDAIAADHEEG